MTMLDKPEKDMRLDGADISDVVEQMSVAGGFGATNLARAVDILRAMKADKNCLKFLSFPACIVATGLRGAIAEMIDKGFVDVIITTCGTLDHDLAKAWGGKYYHGAFELDDAKLHREHIYRLGNVLIPNDEYGGVLEKNMQPILEELAKIKSEWSGRELIAEFGKRLNDESSIVCQAARHNVPIYVPAITDGAFGTNILWFSQDHKFKLDVLADEKELADIAFKHKTTGALMLGGGISKHHTIWWNQFKGGLDYAVYITTATQYDGSLSGARLTEAVSWGKIKENAKYVTVDGDVTIILPFMLAALYKGSNPR
ncbi:MAG: deoxyhypusine synthase [Candidatus Aenigmatarchaeota archaeon]|nr:deoxyhypusine synthase [Candidatus Aenigmarchaeota archaeon]